MGRSAHSSTIFPVSRDIDKQRAFSKIELSFSLFTREFLSLIPRTKEQEFFNKKFLKDKIILSVIP